MNLIRRWLLVVGALLPLSHALAAAADPLVVLVERNPWLMVIGSDSPTFALYSDGLVIFRNPNASASPHLHARLSGEARDKLSRRLAVDSLLDLNRSYEASEVTDQPTSELHVWVGGQLKSVRVYGELRADAAARANCPEPFVRAFDILTKFSTEASPWLPERIEVLLWPYQDSREQPLPWPRHWPGFDQARPRGGKHLYRVFLPSSKYSELRGLLAGLKPNQAVVLANRKWAISYRLPFPQEEQWAR